MVACQSCNSFVLIGSGNDGYPSKRHGKMIHYLVYTGLPQTRLSTKPRELPIGDGEIKLTASVVYPRYNPNRVGFRPRCPSSVSRMVEANDTYDGSPRPRQPNYHT